MTIVVIADNVAHGQPTFQSTTRTNGVSSRAVDGDRNPAYFAGSCTHTLNQANPWWAVDLGWPRWIARVDITNRGDECCCE